MHPTKFFGKALCYTLQAFAFIALCVTGSQAATKMSASNSKSGNSMAIQFNCAAGCFPTCLGTQLSQSDFVIYVPGGYQYSLSYSPDMSATSGVHTALLTVVLGPNSTLQKTCSYYVMPYSTQGWCQPFQPETPASETYSNVVVEEYGGIAGESEWVMDYWVSGIVTQTSSATLISASDWSACGGGITTGTSKAITNGFSVSVPGLVAIMDELKIGLGYNWGTTTTTIFTYNAPGLPGKRVKLHALQINVTVATLGTYSQFQEGTITPIGIMWQPVEKQSPPGTYSSSTQGYGPPQEVECFSCCAGT